MGVPALAAILLGAAVWLFGSGQLGRLRPRLVLPLPGWLHPRPGALPERTRVWCGVGVAALSLIMVDAGGLSPPLAVLVGLSVSVGLGFFVPARVAARAAALQEAVPETCRLLALCLDAGLPPRLAVGAVAESVPVPMRDELDDVLRLVALGCSDADAWASIAGEGPMRDLALDMSRTVGSGIGLADVLRRRASESQRELERAATERVRRVSVSTVLPLMACYLPAFLLLGVVPIIGGVVASWFR